MSEGRKAASYSGNGIGLSVSTGDDQLSWLHPMSPRYYNQRHQPLSGFGQSQPNQYQRMMPLDLSYHHQNSPAPSHSLYNGEEYYNSIPVTSPLARSYYDMDTGCQNFTTELHNVVLPPLTIRPPFANSNLPNSEAIMDLKSPEPRVAQLSVSLTETYKQGPAATAKRPDSLGELSVSQSISDFDERHSERSVSTSSDSLPSSRLAELSKTYSSAKAVKPSVKSTTPLYKANRTTKVAPVTEIDNLNFNERVCKVTTPKKHKQKKDLALDQGAVDCGNVRSHASRSRRPVERYQVIHDYRGKKNFGMDYYYIDCKKPRKKKPPKTKANEQSSVSISRKMLNISPVNSLTNDYQEVINNDPMKKTVTVPADSTTESLSAAPSPASCEKTPLKNQVLLPLFSKSFTSSNLPPIEDDIIRIREAEESAKTVPEVLPKPSPKPLPDLLQRSKPSPNKELTAETSTIDDSITKSTDKKESSKKSSASKERQQRQRYTETPPLILTGRRKLCQTDFYQVNYPQPKRRKSADAHSDAKPKHTKARESGSTPRKGWGGKSNTPQPSASKIHNTQTNIVTPKIPHESKESWETEETREAKNELLKQDHAEEKKDVEEKEEVMGEGRSIGRIVWAKLTARSKAWPAVTIKGSSAAQNPASSDNQWVFWYGEHKVSEVLICRLEDFDVGFKAAFKLASGSIYTTAILEALADCWELLTSITESESKPVPLEGIDAYLEWAASTFQTEKTLLPQGKVTKAVGIKLAEIVEMINEAEDSSDGDDENDKDYQQRKRTPTPKSKKSSSEETEKRDTRATREAAITKIKGGEVDIDHICLSCGESSGGQEVELQQHPLFCGGVCEDCLSNVKDSFFSFGSDGCMSYCVICGNGGELLVCDSHTCGRTYCKLCIELLGSSALLMTIEESDPWSCFLCKSAPDDGLLIRNRDDWKQRLMRFYQKPSKLHNLPECKPDRKLRVLSLFDGIGTAKVVLDNLNLDIEVYYSLEIEDDAIQVINLNHGDDVIQLGDIRSLTEEKLAELGRIDLLVGGSPCNDLALVNPARKGLYDATGTGILFFDFYRILMTLMSRQPDHSVLWLFENVVHMNKETKETISRFLECEPVKLDAGVFSAQSRCRYFWGNIPGMFCPVSPEMMSLNVSLQDVLSKGREAAVNKIRTVTTRGASLLQGKNEDTHAVVMNGQSDKLWPTELERVFGLPVHYTDAGNLAPGKRQKLLGRSWCVPVIEHILKPLTHLFAVKSGIRKQCCSSCTCDK